MPVIEFSNIPEHAKDEFVKCFDLVKISKSEKRFDADKLWLAFPKFAQKKFVRLDLGDTVEEEWDFMSWVDAISSSAIEYQSLEFLSEASGKLNFEQLSWPSGGLEATEELVKVFGGNVRKNDAI
ncbi:hypothetical protein [Arenicella xantha]|uniref:Uncharacterized protein n=1 Tax=Arenicella xantha TaxID=644221 RepID=A0A395JFE8_9GAMM|nr:hypothetical protein [Arenicella xantha]RBP46996.1 hypothetical protein DFR28_1167 [Arenicella xantha]